MGHCVSVFSADEKSIQPKKNGYGWDITFWDEMMERIRDESDWGGYHDYFSVRGDLVFPDIEAARKYIDREMNGYHDGAVKYKEAVLTEAQKKKVKELDDKIQELQNAVSNRTLYKNYMAGLTSKLISCSECGSKLSLQHLVRREQVSCPLCGALLVPKSIQDRMTKQEKALEEARAKKAAYERELAKKKAKIKWLVKFEYHV